MSDTTQLIWKPVHGYPNYEVSNTGVVRKVSSANPDYHYQPSIYAQNNSLIVGLQVTGYGRKNKTVRQLVWDAFNPTNRSNGRHIKCIDGNYKNVNINNLRLQGESYEVSPKPSEPIIPKPVVYPVAGFKSTEVVHYASDFHSYTCGEKGSTTSDFKCVTCWKCIEILGTSQFYKFFNFVRTVPLHP